MEEGSAAFAIAPEFGDEDAGPDTQKSDTSDVSGLTPQGETDDEGERKGEIGDGSVGLNGMKGNTERRAAPARSEWVGVCHGPANGGVDAVTGPGEKRTELFTGEGQNEGSGESIECGSEREMPPADKEEAGQRAEKKSSSGEQRVMDGSQAQHPEGVALEVAPVDDYEKQAGAGEGSEQGDDTEVPHLLRTNANGRRGALSKGKSQQNADGGSGAITGDEKGSELEQNGMHVR